MDGTLCKGIDAEIDPRRADELLARIAAVLGCPVDALRGAVPASGHLEETAELLRLWLAIEKPEDRCRLLELTRGLGRDAS